MTLPNHTRLQASLFITILQDFFSNDPVDNANYREIAAFAMAGLGESPSGIKLLDDWIDAYTTKSEANLVWRTHFYNNPEIMADVEPLLASLHQCSISPVTENDVLYFFEKNGAKLNKIFKTTGWQCRILEKSAVSNGPAHGNRRGQVFFRITDWTCSQYHE